ncbi:hypothetical protein SBRY_70266 [Actinacidiphila bryophytorum]|uniref:Uncharacterized protein n=1 Tax=Actinacidiphila bryophytorum TaxID=1436133 RepID=A0A9W4H7F3_9ACTN|nr:hypothetical protein SBRY_70266 [Actinacidiphila bryophytorum]
MPGTPHGLRRRRRRPADTPESAARPSPVLSRPRQSCAPSLPRSGAGLPHRAYGGRYYDRNGWHGFRPDPPREPAAATCGRHGAAGPRPAQLMRCQPMDATAGIPGVHRRRRAVAHRNRERRGRKHKSGAHSGNTADPARSGVRRIDDLWTAARAGARAHVGEDRP